MDEREDRSHEAHESPLVHRYAGREMSRIFSPAHRCGIWRDLWIWLAEAQMELGLPITAGQIEEMRRRRDPIDFARVGCIEEEVRHEVIAHIRAFAEACPSAGPILHLGATSAYVMDNSDLIQMREALDLVLTKAANVLDALARFALRHRDLPCLGYTHLQPAQPTTVGKRACLWIQDLLLDLREIEARMRGLPFRGVKGTTGTQASFLRLFDGDHDKVEALDRDVTRRAGFERSIPVAGQTLTRKVDTRVGWALAGVAQSATKFAGDIRLLAGFREIEEPIRPRQVGSSAMAYKRNPMRCERIAALARTVLVGSQNLVHTASLQWLERSLDDSANRRVVVPELFLATDVVLESWLEVASGLQVNKRVIESRLARELPFLAAEDLLMEGVSAGGDRQDLHERLRVHARAASEAIKGSGGAECGGGGGGGGAANDFLDRIRRDPAFGAIRPRIDQILDPRRFIGRAPEQVEEFLRDHVRPALDRHRDRLGREARTRV